MNDLAFGIMEVTDDLNKRRLDRAMIIRDSPESVQERTALAEVQRSRVNSFQSFAVEKGSMRKAVFF